MDPGMNIGSGAGRIGPEKVSEMIQCLWVASTQEPTFEVKSPASMAGLFDVAPRGRAERLDCVARHRLVPMLSGEILGMLNGGAITTGSLPAGDTRSPFAFVPWFQGMQIVFAGGPRGVIMNWHERELAMTLGHGYRHLMQQRTLPVKVAYYSGGYEAVRLYYEREAEAWAATMVVDLRNADGTLGAEACPVR